MRPFTLLDHHVYMKILHLTLSFDVYLVPSFSIGPFSKEDVKDYFGTMEIEEKGVS